MKSISNPKIITSKGIINGFYVRKMASKIISQLRALVSLVTWGNFVMIFFCIKSTVDVILLVILQQKKTSFGEAIDQNQRVELEKSIRCLYFILESIGATTREIGPAAIAYSSYLVVTCVRYGLEKFYWRNVLIGNKTGLLPFLRDYNYENKQLANRIILRIKTIQQSNYQYRQLLFNYGSTNGLHLGYKLQDVNLFHGPSSLMTQSIHVADKMLMDNLQHRFPVNGTNRYRKLMSSHHHQFDLIDSESSTRKLTADLAKQSKYLTGLTRNVVESSIWPKNRNLKWQKSMLNIYCYSYIFNLLICFTMGILATSIAAQIGLDALEKSEAPYLELKKYSLIDRVDIMFQLIFISYPANWFSEPVAQLLTGHADQMKQLTTIKQRLVDFNRKLVDYHRRVENLAPDSSLDLSQEMEDLRASCDLEALDLYIILRVFSNEVRSMFILSEYATVFIYSEVMVITTVLVFINSSIDVPKVYNSAPIMLVVLCNLVLYPCAALNNRCIRMTKFIWSMLANAGSFRRHEMVSSNPNFDWKQSQQQRQRNSDSLAIDILNIKTEDRESLRRGQLDNRMECPISTHTLYLWRQFTSDKDLLSDLFSCKIFGVARLNFNTVLQCNFYILSVVLLLLTNL